jgi:hypothetical protein
MPKGTETAARHVHAILAAAVADPMLLERLRRTENVGAAFDFERIRLFAGLALKVRQNDVRLLLPSTFKLLDKLKISVPLFAAYGKKAAALRLAKRTTRSDKLESISDFIEGWLHPNDPKHALVRDALHHERALLALNDSHANDTAEVAIRRVTKVTAAVTPETLPRPAAGLIQKEMSCNPLLLEEVLRSPESDLSILRREQLHLVYCWDKRRGCATATQVDELGHVLFNLANGRRSIARLVEMLRQAGVALTRAQLCRAAQQLVDNGILVVIAPKSQQKRVRHEIGPGR